MQLSISVGGYAHVDTTGVVEFVQAAERLNIDCVWSAEAWGQDAVTSLAYLAACTKSIHLGTGIMQISARVPAMTAMTALSLHGLSGGRFRLGLGASGPQVVEGLHGIAYQAPLTRLKETVEICRLAFAGKKLEHQGKAYVLPRAGGEGKALRLDHKPAHIPIYLATLAPKSLKFTGAQAEGWLGTSFSPEHAQAHFQYLEAGAKSANRTLADLDINVATSVAIGENVEALIAARKPAMAFSLGAMGSASTNFYNDAFRRAGYEEDARAVQALWLQGQRREAAERVPDEMVTNFYLIGTPAMITERLKKYQAAGVRTLNLNFDLSKTINERIKILEQVVDLNSKV